MYIVQALLPPEPRQPNLSGQPDAIEQKIVGQFPLSYNINTRVFALAGSRLTGEQWITLRTQVDDFLIKRELLGKFEVHDFRPSLSKRAIGAVRWLTRR